MSLQTRIGATGFILWGALHMLGGGMILAAALSDPTAGFATYQTAQGSYDALAGAILSYFAYGLVALGLAAAIIGILGNWNNSATALMANTVLVVATEIGLIAFLLVPGHLPVVQAMPGFVLAGIGIIVGGIACTGDTAHAEG